MIKRFPCKDKAFFSYLQTFCAFFANKLLSCSLSFQQKLHWSVSCKSVLGDDERLRYLGNSQFEITKKKSYKYTI